jgi:predicted lipid carrier protein YhbT
MLARLPAYPPAALIAVAANVWFGATLNARNLPGVRGKVIAIEMRDSGLRLSFAIEDEGLVACRNAKPDAVISADARDLLALVRRKEDADTLFFQRRLVMQGDTELALLIRNTLDAIDFRAMSLPGPWRLLDAIALQLRALKD